MQGVDLIYLTHNRLEYTKATWMSLMRNTAWSRVRYVHWYDDGSTDGTLDYIEASKDACPVPLFVHHGRYGNPVAVMADYLRGDPSEVWAKIDNDTLVPQYWLSECLNVMARFPELDLLGIEVFDPIIAGKCKRAYRTANHIGGIGLMRTRAFGHGSIPSPRGQRYGFTEWQQDMGIVVKGWLTPAIPVVLLDRVPHEPWGSISQQYIAQGWQRQWPKYERADLLWSYLNKGIFV
jgi:glycosyltransferase involved in cell wall biosynthesis